MLFALSLLNGTVILLSLLESTGSEDFKVKAELKNLPFQFGAINALT